MDMKLFHQMESERARIPNVLIEDFIPIFVVKSLHEKLSIKGSDSHKADSQEDDDSMWTNNTLLEDNADFEGVFFLSLDSLNHVGSVLKFANEVMGCYRVHKTKLSRYFTEEFEHPCLELLYLLDVQYNILSLQNYLLWLKDASQINYFKQQFLSFAFSPNACSFRTQELANRILEHCLQCFILAHYCNPCSKPELIALKDLTGSILNQITLKLICDGNCRVSSLNHTTVLSMLRDVDIPGTVRTRYFTEHMSMVLCSGKEPHLSGKEALQFQEQLADPTKLLDLDCFNQTVTQMINSSLSINNVIDIITSTFENPSFSWEVLLNFITVWIQVKETNATAAIKDFIKKKIRNGVAQMIENDVLIGFILARHCSLVASSFFSRYEKWFLNLFESETYSPANDPDTFDYLCGVLTEWVPIEPSCFLHVHSTFWPFIPKGCREKWHDYLSIVKSRISEFKEIEEAMEFQPNTNDPLQHEVTTAVKAFEASGKIPNNIYKMWVVSRQRYFQHFLPALLRKPTGVEKSDARLRLVELLRKDGKIPSDDMYAKYKASLK